MDKEKDIKEVDNTTNTDQEQNENNDVSTEQEQAGQSEPETENSVSDEVNSDSTETSDIEPTEKTEATDQAKTKQGEQLNSEEDLAEKDHDDEHDDDHHDEDYSNYSKEELVELIKALAKGDNLQKADRVAKEIKPLYDEIRNHERQQALEKFVADGAEESDFDYKPTELDNRFDANYKLIRDRRQQDLKSREQQKETNLKRKQDILEKLREFVDSEETNISFEAFKELQNEWKDIGTVPGAYAKTLWANYNALIDRFYDNRSIYFELKELDRRKNLDSKIELCERAEKLIEFENLKDAIKELNELHHEFKHIGPVPKDEQEALWQRFKGASDAIYARRKEFVDQLKVELEENLVVKAKLADEVQEFVDFDSDRIKEWNAKTKDILEIQKRWEATGGLPRAKAKEVNKKFWGTFKTFFNNKSAFFKRLDAQREGNLEKKKELIAKAQELKESNEWQKAADQFKQLQRDWKEIGPVPEKYRESVYKEFKEAADHFFERKRSNNSELEKDYEDNLKKKEEICDKIEALANGETEDLDTLRGLQDQYMEIGFVPRKSITKIKNRYTEVVDKYLNSIKGLSKEEKTEIKLENQVNKLLNSPNADQKLYRKEQTLRKQIGKIENDIAVWKNNLEFFASSKTADKLKDEFNAKIKAATDELKVLKKELRMVRTAN
ncbi:DUF349 domain-containing protein [Fulvivirga sediminis]|uniref:DUF349 domain-containing protein n=1 Tax=Fulvivirga sediminis TaxID=2803949 RepID=A0A937F558_9BACT|nr:DUF349 domain-containing protein [Fulvivirga sediminis]MBL3655955.1 DUF349 domain-containing protein [Fulvivirga sediminis]